MAYYFMTDDKMTEYTQKRIEYSQTWKQIVRDVYDKQFAPTHPNGLTRADDYAYNKAIARATKELNDSHKAYLDGNFAKLLSTHKADLVREGAMIGESRNLTEGWIYNFINRENEYEITQSWYVFKENGQWFFKMRKNCKSKHLIA